LRRGVTVVEVLVAVALLLLLIGGVVYFFSHVVKSEVDVSLSSRGRIAVFQGIEIINSDLTKAGYGVDSGVTPVEWDAANKTLKIRYVDYNVPGCEGQTFAVGSPCSYEISYYLRYNNLYRKVDWQADGDGSSGGMFDSNLVKVNDFEVDVNAVTHSVTYTIEGTANDRPFKIGDTVVCRNWK